MITHKKYYSMAFVFSAVAILALIVGTNYAVSAPEEAHRSTPVYLALDDGSPDEGINVSDVSPVSPDLPVILELDDGSYEGVMGEPSGFYEFIFLNRFSPTQSQFPFDLNEVRVYFPSTPNVNVGDAISIVVYQDTDNNPANGATFLADYPASIQALEAWSIYTINPPLNITGPTDVLIGVIALKKPGTLYFPAALDGTNTQQRSWYGEWHDSPPPDPPSLPPDFMFERVDNMGYPGNWMIRGYGGNGAPPTNTPTLTSLPDATPPTPTGTPEPGDKSFLPLTINKHPTATATLPPTPTSEAPTPTGKPSPTPDSGGPEPGTYTGKSPTVSFDVTTGNQVCDFEIKAPFSTGYCILTPPCMDVVNNSFEFSVAEVGAIYSINGNFDTQTHAVGDYSVRMCKGTLQYPPSEGTWEASK